MRALGISGEIEWTASGNKAARLNFRVSRPGSYLRNQGGPDRQKASVHRVDPELPGEWRGFLHTFTGVRLDDARNQRDWPLTEDLGVRYGCRAQWVLSCMVLSSYVMWYYSILGKAFSWGH